MDEQEQTGSSENRDKRKFFILEIEDETPDFSENRKNKSDFSDVQTEMASEDAIFEFEITKDFWEQEEVAAEPEEAPLAEPEEELPEEPKEEEPNDIAEEEEKPYDPFGDFRLDVQPALLFDFSELSEEEEPDIPTPNSKPEKKILRSIASWSLTVLVAFALALIINIFIFRPSEVSGDSMLPTLHNTDTVILSRVPYMFEPPVHGDIVVIDSHVTQNRNFFTLFGEALQYNVLTKLFGQEEPDYFWIKRIIGTAGDEIAFSEDRIYRNGELLKENYINENFIYSYPNGVSVTVPEGYVYVMGDNRNHSTDSRVIGLVPIENIIGKMVASW